MDSITGHADTTFTTQSTNLTTFHNNAALAAGASVLLRIVVYDNANSADNYTACDNPRSTPPCRQSRSRARPGCSH